MAAMRDGTKLWLGGVIPYEINPDLGNKEAIEQVIADYEQQTNIRFVVRVIEKNFACFSMQTVGAPNSKEGNIEKGEQFVNASSDEPGTLRHEIGHLVGLIHEHQRQDREDFIIFDEDGLGPGEKPSNYKLAKTARRTEQYDFQSIMHYRSVNANDSTAPPLFESVTGTPPPEEIGTTGVLTDLDISFLAQLYPSPPVIRRSSGESGAGGVFQTSALATEGPQNTVTVATAVQNAGGKYHLIRWKVRSKGGITRITAPPDTIGGFATMIHLVEVGRFFIAAMRDADKELLLISHNSDFRRLKDSGNQALGVKALHAIALSDSRVMTACVSDSDRLKLIVWDIGDDGTIMRAFDSGDDGPKATEVSSVALPSSAGDGLAAVVFRAKSDRLRLGIWRIGPASVEPVTDSGDQMKNGRFAQVVVAPSGHLVVACRDSNKELLLVPFEFDAGNSTLTRVSEGSKKAGKVSEIAACARPYGLLTAVIDDSRRLRLIKWGVSPEGRVERLGESGRQAGEASAISVTALLFPSVTTIFTAVRNKKGDLFPIAWDDTDGPGELDVP